MSLAILHDIDNGARRAPAVATSTDTHSDPQRLVDGVQSIPWEGSEVLVHTIRVNGTGGAPESPAGKRLLVALLDFRPDWEALDEIHIWTFPPQGQGAIRIRFDGAALRQERHRSVYWLSPPIGPDMPSAEVRIDVRYVHPARLAIGQVAAGIPDISPGHYREFTIGVSDGVLANGPWRSRLTGARRHLEMAFPPDREPWVRRQLDQSEGGLRPVVLVPRLDEQSFHTTGTDALYGYLEEVATTRDVHGFWSDQLLRFTESERAL